MNKFVMFSALLAFALPIGAVVALNMSGGDFDSLLSGQSSNSAELPRGKILFFYAPS